MPGPGGPVSGALALPAHSLGGVFEDDGASQELVPDAVRGGEVSSGARFATLLDESLDLRVEVGALSWPDPEDRLEGAQDLPRRLPIPRSEPPRVHGAVRLPHE